MRFSRIERLVGAEGLDRWRRARIAVIGLGAVGSYAVEALARSGIGSLRVVDFDVIRSSNLNRQLYALESTLGRPKIEVARQRILDINPGCQVEAISCFVHRETMDLVLGGHLDMVLDAIDSLAPKVELIDAAQKRGLVLVSSMGAAQRWDPSQVAVGPLSSVTGCPLARLLRKRLRSRGVSIEFPCVYSTEPVPRRTVPADEVSAGQEREFHERGRTRRTLGSLPTLTGIFGLTLANVALRRLLDRSAYSSPHA